jgi:hypothetical protein
MISGLTYSEQTVHIKKSAVDDVGLLQREANYYYWDRILSSPAPSDSLFSGAVSRSLDRNPTIAAESATSIIPNVGILVDLVQDPLSQQGFQELLQTIQPLGFNLIQLRVTDDFGQVIDYDSIQNVAYHHTSSQINKSNGKNPIAYKYYGRHPLEKRVEWANKVGIQLVPEINLATNGGGWYKTGLLMDCPITLCSSMKQGVAFDVIDKIESVIPIVTAAILELRDIFSLSSSRQFLHLGSDQRERAIKGCFLEAGHTVSESHAALRRFEGKLTTALSMIGIDQNQIIRWHNQENIQYPDRTGNITHYTDISDIVNDESNSSFFGTVHLTNEMTPMEVYLATRRWTMKSPTPHGIVAKAINGQTPKLTHLAAFTIGLRRTENELLPITEEEFQREFDALCERLHCADKEPVVRATNNRPPPAALSLIESCVERTTNVTTKRSRAFLPSSRREQLYQ